MSTMHPSKKTILAAFLSLTVLTALAGGPVKRNSVYQQYIDQYKGVAIEEMQKYGIPASITLAQGLLESGAGRSELSVKGNNHFGIKCHGWQGRTVYHDDDLRGECFRAYDNPRQSYEDHSLFLAKRDRYRRLFLLPITDYKGWAHGLKACGYATNPRYAQSLIDIIEGYELYQYDNVSTGRVSASSAISQQKVSAPTDVSVHVVRRYNNNLYVYARRGDTFASLAKETGVSAKHLAEANERDVSETLREGDVIYLREKAKRADKKFKGRPHVVRAGESLYMISQIYGVKLKSLVKMNKQLEKTDYKVSVGQKLRVY